MHYVCSSMATTALNSRLGAAKCAAASGSAARRHASTNAFYDDRAEEYAAATMGIDTADRISKFAALLPKGGHVLDVGCGSGRDLIALRSAGLKPKGLDTSASLAAIARTRSDVPVTVGDLQALPFAAGSFDGVWAMASLLHVERDQIHEALESLREILVPGGIFFASVKRGKGLDCDNDGRWFTLYDEIGWRDHLDAAGFETIEIVGEPPSNDNATGTLRPGWVTSLARRPA